MINDLLDRQDAVNQFGAAGHVAEAYCIEAAPVLRRLKNQVDTMAAALRSIHSDCSDARVNGLEPGETDNDRYTTIERVAVDALVECGLELWA